ncbi:PREDICTED: uncharacterized protein LOC105563075 [Vollenhovia emeryi]|uniref:uncharacterized protein LOC105563075 n=1 Tax=Vollenhovia emeryi TaxID=411798 RepID=UPI0005F39D70|nr:PREDICTED: uncharacterized protein LOC105563075 [Vollenhovia emeryi]
MKSYVCAILLLMCGVVYSYNPIYRTAEIPLPGCNFHGKFYPPGVHTVQRCNQLICDTAGRMELTTCSRPTCPHPEEPVLMEFMKEGKSFPECCQKYACINIAMM